MIEFKGMKESVIQSRLTRWIKTPAGTRWLERHHVHSLAGELKVDHGKGRIALSQIAEHQIRSLWKAKHGVLTHKISDSSVGFKPCDFITIRGGAALFFFWFENEKELWAVDVDFVMEYRGQRERGSIGLELCRSVGWLVDL